MWWHTRRNQISSFARNILYQKSKHFVSKIETFCIKNLNILHQKSKHFISKIETFYIKSKHFISKIETFYSKNRNILYQKSNVTPVPVAARPKGVGQRPLACWYCGFESLRGRGYLSHVSVVCCRCQLKCDGTRAETRFLLSRETDRVHLNLPVGVSSVDCWQPRCAHQR